MPFETDYNTDLKMSVVIPVFKGGENFRSCMKAIENVAVPPEEIIVVGDGGYHEPYQPQAGSRVKIIETPFCGGPAAARNHGAQIASGDILFFIDSDVVVKPDTIQKVSEIFKNNPNLTALIGSYDDKPGDPNFLSQYRNLLHHYVHQNGKKEASTFWGACGAVRREVFLSLGGFDDKRYRQPAIEDIEFGYRMKKAGYKIRLCKNLQIKHLKQWSVYSMLKTDFFLRALPWVDLIFRDRQFINDLNLQTSSRYSVMLVFGLFTIMLMMFFQPVLIILIPFFMIFLFRINQDLYLFFKRKRGLWFAIKVIPWHWLYYFYSGIAFMIGFAKNSVLRLILYRNPITNS